MPSLRHPEREGYPRVPRLLEKSGVEFQQAKLCRFFPTPFLITPGPQSYQSSDVAVAVAAIRALTLVIRNSSAQTIMGLSKELEEAAQALQR